MEVYNYFIGNGKKVGVKTTAAKLNVNTTASFYLPLDKGRFKTLAPDNKQSHLIKGFKYQPRHAKLHGLLRPGLWKYRHELYGNVLPLLFAQVSGETDAQKRDHFKVYLQQATQFIVDSITQDIFAAKFPSQIDWQWSAENIYDTWAFYTRFDFQGFCKKYGVNPNQYAQQFSMSAQELFEFEKTLMGKFIETKELLIEAINTHKAGQGSSVIFSPNLIAGVPQLKEAVSLDQQTAALDSSYGAPARQINPWPSQSQPSMQIIQPEEPVASTSTASQRSIVVPPSSQTNDLQIADGITNKLGDGRHGQKRASKRFSLSDLKGALSASLGCHSTVVDKLKAIENVYQYIQAHSKTLYTPSWFARSLSTYFFGYIIDRSGIMTNTKIAQLHVLRELYRETLQQVNDEADTNSVKSYLSQAESSPVLFRRSHRKLRQAVKDFTSEKSACFRCSD